MSFCRQGQLWHLWESVMDQTYAFDWPLLTPSGKADLLLRSRNALLSFHQESDPVLRSSTPSAIYYQLAFQAAIILIHRPFFSEPVGTPTLPIALKAGTNASLEICRITRDARKKSSFADFPPHIINYIVCAAVVHLMNATCGRTRSGRRSANNLRTCMDGLGDMGRRWSFRQQAAIRFWKEMAHKWKVVWALPIQHSAPLMADVEEHQSTGVLGDTMAYETPGRDFYMWQSGHVDGGLDPESYQCVTSELGLLFDFESE